MCPQENLVGAVLHQPRALACLSYQRDRPLCFLQGLPNLLQTVELQSEYELIYLL